MHLRRRRKRLSPCTWLDGLCPLTWGPESAPPRDPPASGGRSWDPGHSARALSCCRSVQTTAGRVSSAMQSGHAVQHRSFVASMLSRPAQVKPHFPVPLEFPQVQTHALFILRRVFSFGGRPFCTYFTFMLEGKLIFFRIFVQNNRLISSF